MGEGGRVEINTTDFWSTVTPVLIYVIKDKALSNVQFVKESTTDPTIHSNISCPSSVYVLYNCIVTKSHSRWYAEQKQILILKGIAHQFWINYIFSCLNKRNISYKRSISIKTTLTWNIWENRVLKVSPTEYCYIYHIYNMDWLQAPFFLIISS